MLGVTSWRTSLFIDTGTERQHRHRLKGLCDLRMSVKSSDPDTARIAGVTDRHSQLGATA